MFVHGLPREEFPHSKETGIKEILVYQAAEITERP
jgi:hypothetical protein